MTKDEMLEKYFPNNCLYVQGKIKEAMKNGERYIYMKSMPFIYEDEDCVTYETLEKFEADEFAIRDLGDGSSRDFMVGIIYK